LTDCRQIEQASSITSLQWQSRKFKQEIIGDYYRLF